MLNCSYASRCSGCEWIEKSRDEQRALKLTHLTDMWRRHASGPLPEVRFIAVDDGGLRDRADLVLDRRSGGYRQGLFDRDRREILDLESCPQMSPALQAWWQDFRSFQLPVERGSVRLRVSPTGERGVWLDLANLDVKNLLEERQVLDGLRRQAVVEIGQRRKRLVERDGQLKLADPILAAWFETYCDRAGQSVTVPLFCTIGSFTQPGFRANHALVQAVMFEARTAVQDSGARRAAEFGSGIGNFTLPLASVINEVHAFEVDTLALSGLKQSLKQALNQALDQATDQLPDLGSVVIHSGNFQIQRREPLDFRGFDLIFVDPPRSGLMNFLTPLAELAPAERARDFIYVSCFAESFAADCARLLALGYRLESITLIDQFPQSPHYEIVARLKH